MADNQQDNISGTRNPVVKRMLAFHKLSADAESENRKKGLYALNFRAGGDNQWGQTILNLWREDNRPTESYNQIPQFVHQVTNDMRMNMPEVRFVPGNEASKEKAEVMEDLVRAIQSCGEAEVASDAAVDNQVTIGWGYWRYITEYENDETFDQVIKPRWVPNAFTVYDDPHTQLQDRSDRKKLIEACDVSRKSFNRDFKRDYSDIDISSIGDGMADWLNDETVRIAEYWEVTEKKYTVYRGKDGKVTRTKPKGEIADSDKREVCEPVVTWYKCTAMEVLEQREWPGKMIPYVFVSGEMMNVDGKVIYSGLVENMIASQKQYNYWSNAATEMVALAPRSPFIVDPEQIEGYEKFWSQANIKNYPYLPAKTLDPATGKQWAMPQRAQNSADISSMISLIQQAQQNFYTTTGIYPASLGQASNEKSGKAILARQREGDVSTFHYSDNLARAMRAAGRILADLIPKIYDGARTIRLLKEDKTSKEVKINQHFEDEDGEKKEFDLTVGTYDVMVTTGPSYTTKRQEAAETQMQLLQTPLGQLIAASAPDIIVNNLDIPGADKLAERLKLALPPQFQDQPNQKDIPPQVMQAMEAAGQQIDQLNAALQEATQQLEAAQADNAAKMADVQNKQADIQLKAQQMQLDAEDKARKAQLDEMKLQLDAQKLGLEAQKIQLDRDQAEFNALQSQVSALQPATLLNNNGGAMPLKATEQLRRELAEAETREANELAMQQQAADAQMQAAMAAEQKEAILAANEVERAALMQELVVQIVDLKKAITAPRVVMRDPVTNLMSAVVTE